MGMLGASFRDNSIGGYGDNDDPEFLRRKAADDEPTYRYYGGAKYPENPVEGQIWDDKTMFTANRWKFENGEWIYVGRFILAEMGDDI